MTRNNAICRVNFWGYSTVSFFSPMIRYSSSGIRDCGRDAVNEFKLLVREAHKRGIEVRRPGVTNFPFSWILLSLLILLSLVGHHGCSF